MSKHKCPFLAQVCPFENEYVDSSTQGLKKITRESTPLQRVSFYADIRTHTERVKLFREGYCNPCLEAEKTKSNALTINALTDINYELKDIKQELSWIREAQDNR